ncbi:death-associated inhibitor of apoptosis 2-like isoform X1 [Pieris napi]|uniref:death-associated inhibitor of apoptosis 2-like isoform X1 n=2 Tax=Pieris napi TaxID=78633 RepID=UPI001FBB448C|nr:death-associated inhibitor of apoptosis 2-like isoform X1 [Pieris napi]
MNIEANRLSTFTNWPASAPVDPIRIARAGFFYSGNGTEVECFSCGGKISEWNYGDQVMGRHRMMDPNCLFVVTPHLSGNVPSVVNQAYTLRNEESSSSRPVDISVTPMQYELTQDDLMYRSDALRLLSYVNWDDSSFSREALVNAGFYHAGGGRLRCAWCGGELGSLTNMGLESPLEIHQMYFPMCEFATRRARMDNVNIEISENIHDLPEFRGDTPQPQGTIPLQTSGAEHNEQVVAAGSTWRDLGVVSGGARHPTKASLTARMASFDCNWPQDRPQAPCSLAEAGFFYTGLEDQVRCFYCDGGLGKWEAGDIPWREHARWFPQCGYVLLMKGQQFVDTARSSNARRTVSSAERGVLTSGPRNASVNFPVTESQIENCMESNAAADALGAGLDAARVRRAIVRRLQATGSPFPNSESLIDAVLDDQLNEEAWSTVSSQRFARDILAETLRVFDTSARALHLDEDRSDSRQSSESSSASPLPEQPRPIKLINSEKDRPKTPVEKKEMTLEEENRQLKEARLCKVCMDNEVSMVFLPCGHLVSCGMCSTALTSCPLCRAAVKALVRAYFA